MKYYNLEIKTTIEPSSIKKYDIANVDDVINQVITPYNEDKEIIISGKRISKSSINSIKVVESEEKVEDWVNRKNNEIGKNQYNNSSIFKVNKIDLFDGLLSYNKVNPTSNYLGKIFIVHGHDEGLLQEVKRFVIALGYLPIVLKDMPNTGMTIIEKLESYSVADYVIVLYTPCDEGFEAYHPEKKVYRARQNVVFEHGYFVGLLSRKKVFILRKGEIEMPGDLSGVVYNDKDNKWKKSLVNELDALGLKHNAISVVR